MALTCVTVLLAGIAVPGVAPRLALAASLTVTTTADDTSVNGNCTLREAIIAANTDTAVDACPAGSGADEIQLSADTYTLTITGPGEDAAATGDLDITESLTIVGATPGHPEDTVIEGDAGVPFDDRIFHVLGGSTEVEMSDLSIERGDVVGENGAGLRTDAGTVALTNVVVSDNTADFGSGIFNAAGAVTSLTDCTVSGNHKGVGENSGIRNLGDMTITGGTISSNPQTAIYNEGTLTITGTTLSDNHSGGGGAAGGAIFNLGGTLDVSGATFSDNSAVSNGGAILNTGTATIADSTFTGNGSARGAAIANRSGGTLTVTGSTFSGNSATFPNFGAVDLESGSVMLSGSTLSGNLGTALANRGGDLSATDVTISGNPVGVLSLFAGTTELERVTVTGSTLLGIGLSTGTMEATNVTVSGNGARGITVAAGTLTATNATISDNAAASPGGINNVAGTVNLANTIVAGNTGGDCGGTITSLGHNLDSDGSCALSASGDLSGVDPLLGPLNDYGGLTETESLLAGSPAIDAALDGSCPATDQRLVARPQGAHCDIGAYERYTSAIFVTKFYDANANGLNDDAQPVALWDVCVSTLFTTCVRTGVTQWDIDLEAGFYRVSELPAVQANWIATTPTPVSVILGVDASRSVEFGNVCLGAGGGRTIGFWSNANGQQAMNDGGTMAPELLLLRNLNLRTAKGANFDPTSYSQFRTWLVNASSTNMAYMLSAQLAAMELSVEAGLASGSTLVYAPGTSSANVQGFATVSALMSEANSELGLHGLTVKLSSYRSLQEKVKNALDKANSNVTFVQSTPCTFTFAP